ncbi:MULTISPECIES: caspase family protein [Streptomyces]|uniref:Caspase family protein n=1 Tax=Streptomyces koelreuteriae TaxID=2838015 RepID=A0ABX8FUV9_9ACTN|nr:MULTISPECIES: caspase family protein [Streptomyces]QWB24841.1 caspase family protein [Streptomyces koelreuteriae]UUA07858.1 caspase family protein [Streptomyces koelreuteriae]UUA15487.1 caspase family protein [Streptomyces sp. CRCS-T-1]
MHKVQHKALLIGASEYDDPRIQDLPFVRDDLQRIRDMLIERGFRTAEIVESKRGITPNTVNGRIRAFLRDAGRGDTLLILLSGHGQHFEGKDFLIPEDATFEVGVFAESCIEIGWERELEDSPAAHVVFLVDACREGIDRDTMATLPGIQPWPRRKVADTLRRKVAYVHACKAPQLALFVGEKETVRPGFDPGTQPGESFSLFSRALADTIAADPHALHLHEFATRVQKRVVELHRAYGKTRPPQEVTVVTETAAAPGGEDFPLLPGPDRRTETHPWIRSAERHPVWQRTPDGPARRHLQETCAALASRLAAMYDSAAHALRDDPWHDDELARRTHDRLGFLTGRLADNVALSPTEAALAVLLPLVEQAFWTQEAAQRVGVLGTDLCATGPDHTRFRKFGQGFPRLKRRLRTLHDQTAARDSVERIRWWLFHRWLIQQPELYAAEKLKSLLGEVAGGSDQPPWVTDALSADRLMLLLKEHRTAPFSVRRASTGRPSGALDDHDVIAATTGDEHEVRQPLVSALLKAAYAMAVDPVDLPEIVVEHLGIYDSVDLGELRTTVRRSDWRHSGVGRSLNAVCTHPAVQIALREHADRVDTLLREINRDDNPALAPLSDLPPYADGSRVRLDGNTPDQLSDGIRFQLAEDRVQELLMGEQLYGDRELAVRELYQNALDALRYRDCRTQYLQRTGRPTAPWEGRIEFVQGVGSDGRPYLECRDNGIGMGLTELGSVFSQGGTRFVDLPEYIEEQVAWSELPEPKLRLYPNSRFGIGVLSYFMLADEIVVRTCRMGRDGRPGRLLQVTIAGPGNLFRVEDLGEGTEPGTTVRLLLSRQGKRMSCVDALQRLLWVAAYQTTAAHGSRGHEWVPRELSLTAVEIELSQGKSGARAKGPVCLASGSPDLWWIDRQGIVLSDGLLTETEPAFQAVHQFPYGIIMNLHGEHAPVLTVDRKKVRSFDRDHVRATLTAAAPSLTLPDLPLPTLEWLTQASSASTWFGDLVARHAQLADVKWRIGDYSMPFSKIGYFLPDADLIPLVTGSYRLELRRHHAARFFSTMPPSVLRWRLRALYRAGLGGPVSLPESCPSDELCARPSDLVLLARGSSKRWDRAYRDWTGEPDSRHPALLLGFLADWHDPGQPLSAAKIFALSSRSERPPADVAARLTALDYQVEPLSGCAAAEYEDLPLLLRMGTASEWLAPDSVLSGAQVCVSAVYRATSTPQAARRLRELGFTVPEDHPVREHWTEEEQGIIKRLWSSCATQPSPDEALRISRAQLASVAHDTDATMLRITEFLSELGFQLPPDATNGCELTEDDRTLLLYNAQRPWVDQEVSLLYMTAVARHLQRPVQSIAARLEDLGYAVAPVPDDEGQLPSPAETALVSHSVTLRTGSPLSLFGVALAARQTGISLPEAISVLARWGYRCSVTAEAVSSASGIDNTLYRYRPFADPAACGPVSPAALHAVGGRADALTDFGYDVVPPSKTWLREDHLADALLRTLTTEETSTPTLHPDDPPLSLVTLAVVALSAAKTLRETALKATGLGMRHEIEDWFPAPENPSPEAPTPS